MEYFVSNQKLSRHQLSFSEHGIGRYPDYIWERYVISGSISEFVTHFRPIYNQCIRELKEDDDLVGGFIAPYIGAEKYPSLEEFFLLDQESQKEMIQTYFYGDILRLLLDEDDDSGEVRWAVNSLDSIRSDGDQVIVSGRAVPWPPRAM